MLLVMMAACSPPSPQPEVEETPQPAVTQAPVYSIWLAPYLPELAATQLTLPQNTVSTADKGSADVLIDVGSEEVIARWTYVLAAPFPTVADGMSSNDLKELWNGNWQENFPVARLLVDGSTRGVLEKLWGAASPDTVQVTSREELLARSWDLRDHWAIIPFEQLEPRWKVIMVDGQSPIRKEFNPDAYPLTIPFALIGSDQAVWDLQNRWSNQPESPAFPLVNRDPNRMTTVMLTGVTALVRGTALMMERNGMTYPAMDIGDLLRGADILHISNEISFSEICPNPFYRRDIYEDRLRFCSKPQYIELLEAIGTDVVELTGDHFEDVGPEAVLFTIGMYEERGWQYYGGGKSLADGLQPALFEHNGNRIAFVGCNGKPPGYSTAGENHPGAVNCDLDAMSGDVRELTQDGYNPIFTFQHQEYYAYTASPHLVPDFQKVADAGAVIVSGSQAHQPHAFEFYRDAFLHYGLGNLFFDQYYEGFAQRQAFIDNHIFYDGRHVSTELYTIIFIDLARPRFMDEAERTDLLTTVFAASGW